MTSPLSRHNVLTVGLEDFFQVDAFDRLIEPRQWPRFERRLERSTSRTLELLDEAGARATFFVLGWIADIAPELVRSIAERGHEIASRGYDHRSIASLDPGSFRDDLSRSREAIERAAGVQVLGHRAARLWYDPANQDPRHLRSWLRVDVLPLLRARLPEVDRSLLSVARQAAADRAAWDRVLELLPGLDFRLESGGFSVAAAVLSGYHSPLAETVLGAAARRVGGRLGRVRAGRVLELAARGTSGTSIQLGEGWTGEMAFGRLVVWRVAPPAAPESWQLVDRCGERWWGRWHFRWLHEPAPAAQERAALTAWVLPGPLVVRPWAPGERLRPLGGVGRRLLVRCFQDVRVPRSRRAEWPVLSGPDGVVWVPGVCRSDALLPQRGTEALRIDADYA